jgi:hypothetical protein
MLALVAIATAVVLSACGSPAVTTAPPTARPQEFTSVRYGFRVTLTEDWSAADAVIDWDGAKLQGLASPAFARFTDPRSGRTLVAAAADIEDGMKLADWRAAMVRAAPSICSESPSVEQTTLGGEPALIWLATCSDGDALKLAALHGRLGYIIFLDSQTAKDAEDRRIFDAIRASFHFTP